MNLEEFYSEIAMPEGDYNVPEGEMAQEFPIEDPNATIEILLNAMEQTQGEESPSVNLLRSLPPTTAESMFSQGAEKYYGGMPQGVTESRTFNPDGSLQKIEIQGDPNADYGFQSMGRYATPEEFMRADMEGFKRANPGMWKRMQAEEQQRNAANSLAIGESAKMMGSLQAKMDAIAKEEDPTKKEMMLSELRASVAETGAMMTQNIRRGVENSLGLSRLQAQLEGSMAADRAHPEWQKRMTDSNETKMLRKSLADAQKQLPGLTKQALTENPTLAGMAARLEGFFKTQERLVSNQLNREDKKQAIIEDKAMSLDPEAVKYWTMLRPDLENKPEKVAQFLLSNERNPEFRKQHSFLYEQGLTPSTILAHALIGNNAAGNLTVALQAGATGQPKEVVGREVAAMREFIKNENFFLEQAKILKDPETKKQLDTYQKSMLMDTGKEGDKARMQTRMELAQRWFVAKNTANKLENISPWISPYIQSEPEMKVAWEKAQVANPGKPINIDLFMENYIGEANPKEAAMRADKLKLALSNSVPAEANAVYNFVDKKRLLDMYSAKAARVVSSTRSLRYDMQEGIGYWANKAPWGGA